VNDKMRCIGIIALVVGVVLPLGPAPGDASHEAFATYEDWTTAATLRGDRWSPGSDAGQEIEREVKDDKLLMRFRREGGGPPGFFSHRLGFVNPSSVDQVEAEFRIRHLTVTGCDSSPSTARAVAIDLNRFSDLGPDVVRPPGSLTGDHIARILTFRTSDSADPEGTLSVEARLFRCNNPACSLFTLVAGPVALAQVRIHRKFRLRLVWDDPGDQFFAGLDTNLDVALAYPDLANRRAANVPFALIRIQHLPADCPGASGDAEIEVREVCGLTRGPSSPEGAGCSGRGFIQGLELG